MIAFDPEKDDRNRAKNGLSLTRPADLEVLAVVDDDRFAEPRRWAYGLIDGEFCCLAYVVRHGAVRALSLRRAHAEEVRRYDQR